MKYGKLKLLAELSCTTLKSSNNFLRTWSKALQTHKGKDKMFHMVVLKF